MKKRKIIQKLIIACLFLTAAGGGIAFWLWRGVHAVPEFYAQLEVTEKNREKAEKNSQKMAVKVQKLRRTIRKEKIWLLEFTQDELNHWLAIAIGEKRPGMLPHRLKDPRGMILEDRIRAGVTVDMPEFKGVVSVEVFPRISEPNVLDIELKNVSAGNVRMPAWIFESLIQEVANSASLPIEVLNQEGMTVLRFRFRDGDLCVDEIPVQVNTVSVNGKKILVTGFSMKTK